MLTIVRPTSEGISMSDNSASFFAQRRAYLTLILISLFCLMPFFWVLLAAFDPKASQFLQIPAGVTVDHFWNLLANESGVRWVLNSAITWVTRLAPTSPEMRPTTVTAPPARPC